LTALGGWIGQLAPRAAGARRAAYAIGRNEIPLSGANPPEPRMVLEFLEFLRSKIFEIPILILNPDFEIPNLNLNFSKSRAQPPRGPDAQV
jgi:hypothetical protein